MSENWKTYICRVNGKLASILLDFGLGELAPLESKPWLLWVWVYFKTPRADGLSDGKEAPLLYEIEDALNLRLGQACQAVPCGRITNVGRREFYSLSFRVTSDVFHGARVVHARPACRAAIDLQESLTYAVQWRAPTRHGTRRTCVIWSTARR